MNLNGLLVLAHVIIIMALAKCKTTDKSVRRAKGRAMVHGHHVQNHSLLVFQYFTFYSIVFYNSLNGNVTLILFYSISLHKISTIVLLLLLCCYFNLNFSLGMSYLILSYLLSPVHLLSLSFEPKQGKLIGNHLSFLSRQIDIPEV